MDEATARLALLAWLSPGFPVGSFAFSHGLEWAVETGDIADAADLEAWLIDLLEYGAPRADAVLLAATCREPSDVERINELALALSPSSERRLETSAQGSAFLTAVAAAWPEPRLASLAEIFAEREIAYPVALALAAAAHDIALRITLDAFLLATVSNLVSAVLRLGPIGQSDAQAIIARMAPRSVRAAAFAETSTLDELGVCAWRSDIAAMRHETQYSRLFRS